MAKSTVTMICSEVSRASAARSLAWAAAICPAILSRQMGSVIPARGRNIVGAALASAINPRLKSGTFDLRARAMDASAIRTSASIALSRGLRAKAVLSKSSPFKSSRLWRVRLVARQAQRALELRGQRVARIFEIDYLGRQLVLLDLGAIDILQRYLAHLVLRAGNLLQVGEQLEGLAVDADFFVEKPELVIGLLEREGGLQHGSLKHKIFRLAFSARNNGRCFQLARSGKILHQPRHHGHHDVRDVGLKGEPG